MREHVVEIKDKDSRTFNILLATPSNATKIWYGVTNKGDAAEEGSWRSLDKGFIRYDTGNSWGVRSENGESTARDVYLLGATGIKAYFPDHHHWIHQAPQLFGVKLFEYESALGVNDTGEGFVVQPWVVSLKEGRISWMVVDQAIMGYVEN